MQKTEIKNKGKFIVIYGINNLGKTTQAKMLVEKLREKGYETEYLKYPIYNLAPSGTLLNNYLRDGNYHKLTPKEAQIIYTLNRTQYEKTLKNKLEQGVTIVAEDYTGTGIAWGIGADVDEQFLKYINSHLLKEDLVFLLDGQRFPTAIEDDHKHEQDEELTNKVRLTHLQLAQEKNWHIVNADQPIERVHQAIWKKVQQKLSSSEDAYDFEALIKDAYPAPLEKQTSGIDSKTSEITTINPTVSDIPKIDKPRILTSSQPTSRLSHQQIDSKFTLKIQKITSDAKLPTMAHADDAGLDLYANEHYTLYENERAQINTGIKMAIPNGYVGLIWDKGGIANSGLHTMAGVVDAGYRGEVKVLVINLSNDIYHIAKGQKIAQLLIQKIEKPDIQESGSLESSTRNERAFGSSGLY